MTRDLNGGMQFPLVTSPRRGTISHGDSPVCWGMLGATETGGNLAVIDS